MKKMKRVLGLALGCSMVLGLAGCGGGGQSGSSSSGVVTEAQQPAAPGGEADALSDEPVTIKFANYAILEAGYAEFWEGVKSGFEEQYPNITIEWVTAPYGEVVNQVINMAGGGDRVDLLFGEIGWVPTLEDSGLSVPVDTILTEEFLNDFYPNVMEAHSIGGRPYAIPVYVSPYVLYYNTQLFEKAGLDPDSPPATYDEMLAMAAKLNELKTDDGNKVYAFGQTTASVAVSGSSLTGMVFNFGGHVLDEDGQLDTDNQGMTDAFTMVKQLDELGYNPQNAKLKDLRNLFALGQLAMYYDQSWGFNGVQSINPEAVNFTASASPLAGGSGTGNSILQSHCIMMMDNGEAKTEASRLLIEYLITEEVLNDYMKNTTPAYPARQSMSNMDAVVNNNILKGAAASIDQALPTPFISSMNDLNLELCTLAQAVTTGGKSVDEAIADFNKAAGALTD